MTGGSGTPEPRGGGRPADPAVVPPLREPPAPPRGTWAQPSFPRSEAWLAAGRTLAPPRTPRRSGPLALPRARRRVPRSPWSDPPGHATLPVHGDHGRDHREPKHRANRSTEIMGVPIPVDPQAAVAHIPTGHSGIPGDNAALECCRADDHWNDSGRGPGRASCLSVAGSQTSGTRRGPFRRSARSPARPVRLGRARERASPGTVPRSPWRDPPGHATLPVQGDHGRRSP